MAGQDLADTPEARKAVFHRLVEAYATADLDALDALVARTYVGHPATGDRDLEGLKASIRFFHDLYIYAPDSFIVEDQLVDGDRVATRMSAHVRLRATGAPVTLLGINIAIIRDGRIHEEWNTWEAHQPA